MLEQKKTITQDDLISIGIRTVAMAIAILVAAVLFNVKMGFDVSFILIPFIIGVIVFYLGSLASLLLAGKMAGPMARALYIMGVTVFLALIFIFEQEWPDFNIIALPIFILGVMIAANGLLNAYSGLLGHISMAGIFLAAGFFIQEIFLAFGLGGIGFIIFIGLAVAAVFSAIGMFYGHGDPYISYAGQIFNNTINSLIAGALGLFLMAYFIYVRPFLIGLASIWLVAVEWLILCGVVAILFFKARSYVRSISEPYTFGDGHTVAGKIGLNKEELEKTAAIIQEFVESGKKEALVARAAQTLVENGSSLDTIQQALGIIINHYDEKEPWIGLKWVVGDPGEANRRNRQKAANDLMGSVSSSIKAETG
jgi:hypothetical protein